MSERRLQLKTEFDTSLSSLGLIQLHRRVSTATMDPSKHYQCRVTRAGYLAGPASQFLILPPILKSTVLDRAHGIETPTPTPPADVSSKLIEMSTTREILFVAVCAVSHLMTQAALGQALVPMDIIAQEFGQVSAGEMSWFIAAYSLTVGTFIMISGQLGDIFGHKRVFAFGYAWLAMWSCFAGFSGYIRNQIFFGICRSMQGIGPALLMPNALAMFGRAYRPGIRKNIVFSLFGALAPTGFVIGAASGSLFAQLTWWPWAFWTYGLASFALCAFSLLVIPKPLAERPKVRPKFDVAGSFLVVAGLVLVNVAFNNAPLYGWDKPHVYFILIIGLMCVAAFVWVELRAENPLLPLHALNSTSGYVLALIALGWGSFGIWVFYNVRFLQVIRGATPLSVSAQYAPAVLAGTHRCRHDGLHANAHARQLCDDDLHGGFPCWDSGILLPTRAADILGANIHRHRHNAFWHGHVLSSGDRHSLKSHAKRTSRTGGFTCQYRRQLLHLHCARYCRHGRGVCPL